MNIQACIATALMLATTACSSQNVNENKVVLKQQFTSDNQVLFITSENKVTPLNPQSTRRSLETQKIILKEINYNRDDSGLLTVSTVLKNNSEAAIQIDAKTEFKHNTSSNQFDSSTWQRIYVPAKQEVTYQEFSLYDAATSFTLLVRESSL